MPPGDEREGAVGPTVLGAVQLAGDGDDAGGLPFAASGAAGGWSPAYAGDAGDDRRRAWVRCRSRRTLGAKPRRCQRFTCSATSTATKRASRPKPSSVVRSESSPAMVWAPTMASGACAALGALARCLRGLVGVALRPTRRRVGVGGHARGRDPPRALGSQGEYERVAYDQVEGRGSGGVHPGRLDRGDLADKSQLLELGTRRVHIEPRLDPVLVLLGGVRADEHSLWRRGPRVGHGLTVARHSARTTPASAL